MKSAICENCGCIAMEHKEEEGRTCELCGSAVWFFDGEVEAFGFPPHGEAAKTFRETRERLGSRADVAKLLHTPYRTVEDWEAGKARIPGAAQVALRLLLAQRTKPE